MISATSSRTRIHPSIAVVLALVGLAALMAPAAAELADGLVAYWSFDEDFSATAGGSGFDGTPINGPSIDPGGRFFAAAYFERANLEYVSIAQQVIQQGQDHSYSAWYRLAVADLPTDERYFVLETTGTGGSLAYSASYGPRDYLGDDIGQVFTIDTAGDTFFTSFPGATGADWHNIIITYDADNAGAEHTVYLDGAFVTSFASGPMLKDTVGLIIGSYRDADGRFWDGWIDDVAFWDRVITSDEIDLIQDHPVLPAWGDATSGPLGDPDNGYGVAWGDFDNDGDLDLYMAGNTANKLLRNDGGGTFADVTSGPLGDTGSGRGVAWGDYDNDGDLDLYLANSTQANKLLRNDGGGTFADVTSGPLGDTGASAAGAWADYDNDGDLDLYLSNYNSANKLLRNDGGGTFVDATSGPLGDTGQGRSVAWGDYDDDGDLDLYLAKNVQANKLFRNDGGGTFVDATSGPLGDTGAGQGVVWGDYDNDGDLDLYLSNYIHANKLFRNDGGGTFVDATSGALTNVDPSKSVAWIDYDNDGDLDLYLSNYNAPNRLYRNDGGGTFVDATSGPLGDAGISHGMACGDYDGDGDLDIYVANEGSANKLFNNEATAGNHWLQVKLTGTDSNRDGIGARVSIVAGGQTQIREVSGGSGYMSQNSLPVEFGLGTTTIVDSLIVSWPSGVDQVQTSLTADQLIEVVEDPEWVDATSGPLGHSGEGFGVAWGDYDDDGDLDLFLTHRDEADELLRNDGGGVFTDVTSGPLGDVSGGRDAAWGDYDNDGDLDLYMASAAQNKLYRNDGGGTFTNANSGPLGNGSNTYSTAWGDYDNDGDLDLYLSSASGVNKLLRNEGGDTFTDVTSGPLGIVNASTGTAWGDYDNDGDLDLYVCDSGGANTMLRNDGGGNFTDATSGPLGIGGYSRGVAWGDYDNDEDLDLYVGNYTANNLLRNDGGGTFTDVTSGPLGYAQDTRGVAWGDYDNDGDLDLYLVNERNSLLRNDGGGIFTDATSGPLGNTGDGRGVAWGDYDNDGDLDLYLMNWQEPDKLFSNEVDSGNHWLHVKLVGTDSNRSGVGARVRVVAGGQIQIREVSGGTGYGSQNSLPVEFGLGAETTVSSLIVTWPSGIVQELNSIAADQMIEIVEYGWLDETSGPLGDTGSGVGVAWGDYDDDGDQDLYLSNHNGINKLLRNDGGSFTDATSGLLGNAGYGAGVAWGDYDNDGDLDLYLSNFLSQANKLFRNEGGGTFVDATSGPLGDGRSGQGVAWADYDQDGDLDLYLANYAHFNALFRNDGGGVFVDVASGPIADVNNGVCVAWGDYDDDGDPDLYLGNSGQANKLFRNDGAGNFTDVTSGPLGDTGFVRGADWGDYDNDGDMDLFLTNYNGPNALLRNDGGGIFTDATSGPLVNTGKGLGTGWADYDNDGDLDLYVSHWDEPCQLLRNDGGGSFTDATVDPLGDTADSRGLAWGDYDNDGDLDIYLANIGANKLFRNVAGEENHWLHVKLTGTMSNKSGIGARVSVVAGGQTQIREVSGGSGYLSQKSLPVEFGLGTLTSVSSVIVTWPSGYVQEVSGIAVDQILSLTEPEAPTVVTEIAATPGHEKVTLTWTDPAAGDLESIEIWRGPWHDGSNNSVYPEYDDASGNTIPTRPSDRADALASAEWTLAGTVPAGTGSFTDSWSDRGVHYYEIFVKGQGPNYGPPAANNVRATNYWLGDLPPNVDGYVDASDVTVLASAVGACDGDASYNAEADIGPTDDHSGAGVPLTDDCIGFEDFMIMALNYGFVTPQPESEGTAIARLSWYPLDERSWALSLLEPCADLKGIELLSDLPAGLTAELTAGPLLLEQSGPYFLQDVAALDIYLIMLGGEVTILGEGELFRVTLSAEATPGAPEVICRSASNEDVEHVLEVTGIPELPTAFRLAGNYPNPFNPSTTISYDLPEAARVRLSIYDLTGRLVRVLADEAVQNPGFHQIVWDGRDDSGKQVSSGVYFYRFEAGSITQTKRMVLLK